MMFNPGKNFMPFTYPLYQKLWTLETFDTPADGPLPVANVECWTRSNPDVTHAGRWVMVCPCCGCLHEVSHERATAGAWDPNCQGRWAYLFINRRRAWLVKHPEAVAFKRVWLVDKT